MVEINNGERGVLSWDTNSNRHDRVQDMPGGGLPRQDGGSL